ncbi:hypothetical protein P9B03_01735 [Metasolibacillus meyeri]|uniref:Uncharacterized protein n=1 Tax=Metasolibacillus meyeri TaxID=1071052 RepID=A0AAW9NL10_9BACL|nr:hypothetical protein [Metasolibacillus meyeri]MEC1177192.1 hypothetical protein [Metasolibacillus meyeri]
MSILQDQNYEVSRSEVEFKLLRVNEQSVLFEAIFRAGAWPEIAMKINCLKRDFYTLLDNLRLLENTHLSKLEMHDPGIVIYHIPQFGTYYYPSFGPYQIPENEHHEWTPYYELIFMLDAGEKNTQCANWRGPALSLAVTQGQIEAFVASLKKEASDHLWFSPVQYNRS